MKLFKFISSALLLAGMCIAQVAPGPGVLSSGPTSAITGQIQTATGGSLTNSTLSFALSQPAIVSGTSSIASSTSNCYTSSAGNIVGVPDPLALPVLTVNTSSGTLPAANYYVKLVYVSMSGKSLPSPEASTVLSAMGTLNINAPLIHPTSATGYAVYISSSSGTETLQGTVTGWGQFQQSTFLATGATLPTVNSSACNIYFSDQLIPTGTYYTVDLVNKNGSEVAGYPQTWCTYGGSGATINVSQGVPTGNCNTNGVFYPTPVFANPPANTQQSISGPLSLGTYPITAGAASFQSVNGSPLYANKYPGPDIATQVNNAYNSGDCPASGCRIRIPAGLYGTSVPIVAGTAAKPLFLECDQGGQGITTSPTGTTQIVYSGTGAFITFNTGGGTGAGMSGCTLTGPGGSTTGLLVGGNFGTTEGVFSNNDISGFGVGIQFGSNTYVTSFHDNVVHDNSKQVFAPSSITGFGENITFTGGDFYNKSGAQATGIDLEASGDYHFIANSFDEAFITIAAPALQLDLVSPHFENPVASTPIDFLTITSACTACRVSSTGGYWLEDGVSARTEFVLDAGANSTVQLFGGSFTAAETVAQIVRFTGSNSSFFGFGLSNFQTEFTADATGALESISCSNTVFPSVCLANHPFATNAATLALSTSAIPAHSCAAAQTVALAGVVTGSVVNWSYASTPIGVTGYGDSTTPFLDITTFGTTNTANVVVCNQSSGSITPGAMSLNLRPMN